MIAPFAATRTLDLTSNLAVDQTDKGFCPTQLALSPDQTKLLVLDDPGDPALGQRGLIACASTTRQTRLVLFDLAGSPTRVLEANGAGTNRFDINRAAGPVAIAMSNAQAFVLSTFANQYNLYRFNTFLENGGRAFTVPGLTPQGQTQRLDLEIVGAQLFLGFANPGGTGQTYAFDPNATAVGDPLKVGTTDVGPTYRFATNRAETPSVAFLNTSNVRFLRGGATASAASAANAVAATFTPDSYGYTLSENGVSRFDVASLPALEDPAPSSQGLFGFQVRAIGWVLTTP